MAWKSLSPSTGLGPSTAKGTWKLPKHEHDQCPTSRFKRTSRLQHDLCGNLSLVLLGTWPCCWDSQAARPCISGSEPRERSNWGQKRSRDRTSALSLPRMPRGRNEEPTGAQDEFCNGKARELSTSLNIVHDMVHHGFPLHKHGLGSGESVARVGPLVGIIGY